MLHNLSLWSAADALDTPLKVGVVKRFGAPKLKMVSVFSCCGCVRCLCEVCVCEVCVWGVCVCVRCVCGVCVCVVEVCV